MFQPGNQLAVGKGRPKGSGKAALFRQWIEEHGMQKLFDTALGKGHGYRVYGKRIVEIGPNESIQFEALKLVLAYGLGRPIVPFVLDDRSRSSEESKRRADEVVAMIKKLEEDANSGGNTGSEGSSMGSGAAEVQAPT